MQKITDRNLQKLLLFPELDYQALMGLLSSHYLHPRRKIQELMKNGILHRLKKGFYVVDPSFSNHPYSAELVANLLYGPSYLSLTYALSHYQFIPERVEEWTSVTLGKNKIYQTEIGTFSYAHLGKNLYPLGIEQLETSGKRMYLIASPEKAFLDYMLLKTSEDEFRNPHEVRSFLEEDLRCDWRTLTTSLNKKRLESWLQFYNRRRRVRWFIEGLKA